MNVGDLVKMRPAMADPKLYGVGLVVKVEGSQPADQRCFIRWPTMPDREPRRCARYVLELVSASR
jgi:hypothetical protein